jgi:CRP/FNR family transcriptional regulator, cyclic AMP receptor protein
MSVEVAALKNVPLFSSLSEKHLKKLIPLFDEHSFDAGHVIAEEGKQGFGFFMIKSGTATVMAHGKQRATLGPGSHFGEIAALDPGPRVATVTAETDLAVYRLDAWDFRRLVTEDATLAAGIIDGLVQIVRRLEGYEDATGADADVAGS